jgi:hypothetical protein
MELGDAFKLLAAREVPGVERTYLVAVADVETWARHPPGAELFDDREHAATELIGTRYREYWRRCIERSSRERPTRVPAAFATQFIAEAPLRPRKTKWGLCRLRVAAVDSRPACWLDLEPDGSLAP